MDGRSLPQHHAGSSPFLDFWDLLEKWKKNLKDSHYNTNWNLIRIFWYCRICRNLLIFLHGAQGRVVFSEASAILFKGRREVCLQGKGGGTPLVDLPLGGLLVPLVLTSSGGHCSGQYASYWSAFFFITKKILVAGWSIRNPFTRVKTAKNFFIWKRLWSQPERTTTSVIIRLIKLITYM